MPRFAYRLIITIVLSAAAIAAACASHAESPQISINNANWSGVDGLGRKLPTYREVGPPKKNRWVGLFYWQWHNNLRCLPDSYNVTEYLQAHPGFRDFEVNPQGGPPHPTWYWAEPLFGYYKSTDPWVVRKHLIMIADAGVDFLFFDYTNSGIYDNELAVFLRVAKELKSKGVAVPKLAFFLNFQPEWKAEALYKKWYKPGTYDDMWFMWDGKPLMMAAEPTDAGKLKDPSVLPELQGYFTWRQTWALHDPAKYPTRWRFLDGTPQRPALGPDGKIEQMVVSKSTGGPINTNMQTGGVSCVPGHQPVYDNQWCSKDCAKGLFFQEQWKTAGKIGAPILLVTGWNEWTASVWNTHGVPFLGKITNDDGTGYFVDEFNMEFNRDLEPMKSGYADGYYMQFVANMRRYKGMTAPQTTSPMKTIRIDGKFGDWNDVTPLFRDARSDTAQRDFNGTVPHSHYVDNSTRNDIVTSQVARDKQNIYFRVTTSAPLTPSSDKNWMMLLINSDCSQSTGWHGYDYLIDRTRAGGNCSVERCAGTGWNWKRIGMVRMAVSGNSMELSLPLRLLRLNSAHGLRLDFKWIDNMPTHPKITDFYIYGDAAPDGRFNYHYEVK